jgi:(2Fe-2S) ferredoxin
MESSRSPFAKYIFVCENQRESGVCCAPQGTHLREILKSKVKAGGLEKKIRVSRSGCLDVCAEGPNVLVMPDNVWFKRVEEKDIDAILKKVSEGL